MAPAPGEGPTLRTSFTLTVLLGLHRNPGGTGQGRREIPSVDKDVDDLGAEGPPQGLRGNDGASDPGVM